jgi:hypothetical protein
MSDTIRSLSETEIDAVAGGVQDAQSLVLMPDPGFVVDTTAPEPRSSSFSWGMHMAESQVSSPRAGVGAGLAPAHEGARPWPCKRPALRRPGSQGDGQARLLDDVPEGVDGSGAISKHVARS